MIIPTFPPGFLWGVTTGAHQTEGNNVSSDWWARENAPGSPLHEPSGDAADSYHRWREDMNLASNAGFTDYRFGIEWSRVEPVDGRLSLAAIDHYKRIVEGAHARGLRPMPTLHHFTNPLWFSLGGGWRRDDAVDRFLRYVDALAPVLDAGVERVEMINEPNIVAALAAVGQGGNGSLSQGLPVPDRAVTQAMISLHHAVRARLKDRHPDILTGWGVSVQDYQAAPGAEVVLAEYVRERDEVFIEAARGDDWFGLQTYTRGVIVDVDGHPEPTLDPKAELTQTGWEYYPQAIAGAARRAAQSLGGVPIIVTENGIATDDDQLRIRFVESALESLGHVIDEGLDIGGYFHWSLLDNYEWGSYGPKFGLVSVDRTTFTRSPNASLAWLGALAKTHIRQS